jgi:uncharacterized protein YwlG (UPF0340 family)
MCDTHVSSCDYVAQEVIALLTVSCQKGQCTGLPFHFVFCKHLQHRVNTIFENKVYQTQFREEVTVTFVENAGEVTKL